MDGRYSETLDLRFAPLTQRVALIVVDCGWAFRLVVGKWSQGLTSLMSSSVLHGMARHRQAIREHSLHASRRLKIRFLYFHVYAGAIIGLDARNDFGK